MLKFHLFDAESLGALGVDLVLHIHAFEWKISKEHPEEEDTDGPDVDLVVINMLFEDLGGHIGGSPAECVHVFVILPAKSQVAYLDNITVWLSFGRVRD